MKKPDPKTQKDFSASMKKPTKGVQQRRSIVVNRDSSDYTSSFSGASLYQV